jgi:hypothetical protein
MMVLFWKDQAFCNCNLLRSFPHLDVNPSNVLNMISTKVGKHVPSLDMPQFIMPLLPSQYQLFQQSLVHAGCGFAILNSGCKS